MSRHVVLFTIVAVCACGKTPRRPRRSRRRSPTPQPRNRSARRRAGHGAGEGRVARRRARVYSLVDNRLSAHLARGGGLVVAAGSAGLREVHADRRTSSRARKQPWELRQTEGDIKVARMTGKSGTVFVPLTARAGRAHHACGCARSRRTTARSACGSTTTRTSTASSTTGWSTVELAVPAGQLNEGENALALFAKSSGARARVAAGRRRDAGRATTAARRSTTRARKSAGAAEGRRR